MLECVNLEELAKTVKETVLNRVFIVLEFDLYSVKANEWSEAVGYDKDRAYLMFKLMTNNFILIPKHKKFSEFLKDKSVESVVVEVVE